MTHYFDDAHAQLDAIDLDSHDFYIELEQLEQRVVFDCTVCAQAPDFPEDLREAIHKTVLKYGVRSLPVDADRDFEHVEQHVRFLGRLFSGLHTIFHTLAYRRLEIWWDSPLAYVRRLYTDGEEIREKMIEAEGKEAFGLYVPNNEEKE